MDTGVEITDSYIIFLWPQHEDVGIMDTLTSRMGVLKVYEGALWDPRGKFVVVVADSDGFSPKELGLKIYVELWKEHFIIDNTILIVTRDKCVKINSKIYTDRLRKDTLDLYTGLP